ncbi:MAG TPA: hypothetical protein VLH75_09330 [Longimicrobiales bacterium]|nr:hypothetical protein [Longimicrobiales bacterium]
MKPDRVEEHLPSWLRPHLAELCALYGVLDPARWHHHRHLRRLLTDVAVLHLRDEYVLRGYSRTRGLVLACAHLGLNDASVKDRLLKARADYLHAVEDAEAARRTGRLSPTHHLRRAG